jgi:hypothetical protein
MVAGFAVTANAQCAKNETYISWACGEGCAYYMEGGMPLYLSTVNMQLTKRSLTWAEKRKVESELNKTCLGGGPNASLDPAN